MDISNGYASDHRLIVRSQQSKTNCCILFAKHCFPISFDVISLDFSYASGNASHCCILYVMPKRDSPRFSILRLTLSFY